MSVNFLYKNPVGRGIMQIANRLHAFKIIAWFLKTGMSKIMINNYIKKYNIDMTPFGEQEYNSFADFFARKKDSYYYDKNEKTMISPCDGLLTVYPIDEYMNIPMKESLYRLEDLIHEKSVADMFKGGLCMVFRLQASDYHHFCFFDTGKMGETCYREGQLHSVQPIACERVPVYRLNRRWWNILETENFGTVAQIEVGAMAVGGVKFLKEGGCFTRGEEMGNFELAGSTIILLVTSEIKEKFTLFEAFRNAAKGDEVPVKMGYGIGTLN